MEDDLHVASVRLATIATKVAHASRYAFAASLQNQGQTWAKQALNDIRDARTLLEEAEAIVLKNVGAPT